VCARGHRVHRAPRNQHRVPQGADLRRGDLPRHWVADRPDRLVTRNDRPRAHSPPAGGRPRFLGLGTTTGSKSCPSLTASASASATIEPKDGAARPASMALIIRGSRPTRSARVACVSFIRLRCRATLAPNTTSFSARRSGTQRPYRGPFASNRSLNFLFLLAWAGHANEVGTPRAPDPRGPLGIPSPRPRWRLPTGVRAARDLRRSADDRRRLQHWPRVRQPDLLARRGASARGWLGGVAERRRTRLRWRTRPAPE
jgi:hypothetical protein